MTTTGQLRRAQRAERAAVRAVAERVDAARLTLARALAAEPVEETDRRVDRALGRLLPLLFSDRPRRDRLRALRSLGVASPAALLDELAPLLSESPTPELALRLVRAHEINRQSRLVRDGGRVTLARCPQRRRQGVYYTPPDVVAHIVARTLGAALAPLEAEARRLARRGQWDGVAAALASVRALKVLDPACGGGLFLLGALERFRATYQLFAELLGERAEAALAAPGRLALAENLFGVDLDLRALELAELLLRAQVDAEPGQTPTLLGRALVQGDHLDGRHAEAFPEVFARKDPGFDVVLGNPPYAALDPEQRSRAREAGFRCHDAGDLYALFVEGLVRLGRRGGRGGLIVPLSLTFSRHFRSLREQVLLAEHRRWQIACFDRIPSGLFEAEVRTRTAIVVCEPADAPQVETARLLRFTAAERPRVLEGLRHLRATALHHPQLGFPKLGSPLQARWLKRLLAAGARLGGGVDKAGEHRLHYKHNCYAFAVVAAELPPAFDEAGEPVPQTKYSSLGFSSRAARDQALAVTAGAWLLWWWLTYGDGFDMTGHLISALPIDPRGFSAEGRRELARLGARIRRRARRHVAYKKNSGKRIGTFDLRACRELTDAADDVVAGELGAERLLEDVRALLSRTHGTMWAGA
jgi:hypothetical protein